MAVMSAMPAPTAATSPVESTVATSVSSLDHSKVTPPIMVPSEVRATAMSWRVSPTWSITGMAAMIVTLAITGADSSTVTVAGILDIPFADAVIIAVPAVTAATSPVLSTVATSVSSLVQVNSTSSTAMPSEVNAIAMNWNVPPTSNVIADGLNSTLATTGAGGGGSLTFIVTGELVTPSAAARIEAVPAATAVATPAEVMVTTLVSLLDHEILTSSRAAPPAVRAVAVKVIMAPTIISWVEEGETVTRDTGATVTVIVAGALDMPFPVALIVAVPALTAVATPPELMVTIAVLLLVQVKSTPFITAPSEALAVATNLCVLPTSSDAVLGLTSTTETVGAGGGAGGVGGWVEGGLVGEESPPPQPAARKPPAKTRMATYVVIILYDIQPPTLSSTL